MSVIKLTEVEIREQIEAIYERHPELRGFAPTAECRCCRESEAGYRFGWDTANAYSEIHSLRWLLGDDE